MVVDVDAVGDALAGVLQFSRAHSDLRSGARSTAGTACTGRSVGDMADSGSGRYQDLDRPGLDAVALVTALQRGDGLWRAVDVVDEIGSTNAELAARAPGEGEGLVLVAEHQSAVADGWTAPGRRRRGPG